jgi:GT2 family glycosyltransferase
MLKTTFPTLTLLQIKENCGYAGGVNVGIQYALDKGATWILLLNNDTVVDPQFLSAFSRKIEKNPNVGILGGWPIRFYKPDKLDHLGGVWDEKKGKFTLVGLGEKLDFQLEEDLDYICGCSSLIRREVFEKIGLFEPSFFCYWEEADFCMRAKRAGFALDVCPEAKLWHKVAASFTGGKPHVAYYWWRNRFLWTERNLPKKSQKKLLYTVLLPEILHLYKMRTLKSFQLFLQKQLRLKKDLKEKEQKLLQYRASLQGFHDYVRRRFGSGPDWLFRKPVKIEHR